ncbi:MAG: VOC family protein [Pseudomonadota bacterium]
MTPTPYLIFQGQCREALMTYAEVLGGEITTLMVPADMPAIEVPEERADWIMHSELTFDGGAIMASDDLMGSNAEMGGCFVMMELPGNDAARTAFEALSRDGTIIMPYAPTPWSEGFGMLKDRFGTQWMLSSPSQGG